MTDAHIKRTTEQATVGAIEWLDDQAKRSLPNNFQRFMWSPTGCEWCRKFFTTFASALTLFTLIVALFVIFLLIAGDEHLANGWGLLVKMGLTTAGFIGVATVFMGLVDGPSDDPVPVSALENFKVAFPDLARQVIKDFPVDNPASWRQMRRLVQAAIEHNEGELEAAKKRASASEQSAALSSH